MLLPLTKKSGIFLAMSFPSVDKLQQTLAENVFHYAKDTKKASGRALGTLVEIITYYTLRAWGLRDYIVIEKSLSEFGNPEISHNVEFSLHPILSREKQECLVRLPITPKKLAPQSQLLSTQKRLTSNQVLSGNLVKRNSCLLAENPGALFIGNLNDYQNDIADLTLCCLHPQPFAMFECKRVGVETGMKKGPQTIEKAKQGAYVARVVSSLQKLRTRDGQLIGYIERDNGEVFQDSVLNLVKKIVASQDSDLLSRFILTIGVVSNHGNWFTSENQNKELKVLAQSYDWLLFLTDTGLAQFIDKLLLNPEPQLEAAKLAFLESYHSEKTTNCFTKVQMNTAADNALQQYFQNHQDEINGWYNVITKDVTISDLRQQLDNLCAKNWKEVHQL
jgi:hypothetical protein